MNLTNSIDGLVLYGSMPRGDFDAQSDRDVLIVADNQGDRLEAAFTSAGFSPTVYSWLQLDALAQDGSLFVQHLKQESRILLDRSGRFSELLSGFEPKAEYSFKLWENRRLFEMTNGVSVIAPAVNWAFDVLAVAFRNQAILHFAQTGRYIFSYAELVREMNFEFGLQSEEVELLIELRMRKRQYRVHPCAEPVSLWTLQRTQGLLERLFQVECASTHLSPQDFVSRLLEVPHSDAHWYYLLRRYEGAYRTMGFAPAHDAPGSQAKIEHIFGKPSPYGNCGSNSIVWVQNQVQRLASHYFSHLSGEDQPNIAA